MKKSIYILMLVLAGFLNLSCSKKNDNKIKNKSGELSVISTIFPSYDWICNITEGCDGIKNEMLIKNGVDVHNFQPSVADIIKISQADLFIYVGGESDGWVEEVLQQHKNVHAIKLLDLVKADLREEELIEGMESEEEESEENGAGDDGSEYDEHVWLSVKCAMKLCAALEKELCLLDEKNSEIFTRNFNSYNQKLLALDKSFEQTVLESKNKTLLFCDRFPFRYMFEDYGMNYFAAFAGCSAQTAASFETMAFLTQKLNELNLENVIVLEKSDKKIAETVIKNSQNKNQQIKVMNSLQAVTTEEVADGSTYLSLMEYNLSVLKDVLN